MQDFVYIYAVNDYSDPIFDGDLIKFVTFITVKFRCIQFRNDWIYCASSSDNGINRRPIR